MSYNFSLRPSKILWFAAALVCGFLISALTPSYSNAQTSVDVPQDWALIPTGVNPGDSFRLMFVSSTAVNGHVAPSTSSDIANYNTFIQNVANTGHTAIRPYNHLFKVLGSTAAANARFNTGTTSSSAEAATYYLGTGAKIADNNNDLYDASWDTNSRDDITNERGEAASDPASGIRLEGASLHIRVWTGTTNSGAPHSNSLRDGNTALGDPTVSGRELASISGGATQEAMAYPFYGISPRFTVVAQTGTITLSPTTLTVDEESSITFTAELGTQPRNPVVLIGDSTSNPDFSIMPVRLTFGTGDWNTGQTVTLNVAADSDFTDDTSTVTYTVAPSSSLEFIGVTATVSVSVTDNDITGDIMLSDSTLTVGEGADNTHTVQLTAMPSGEVTVTPSTGSDSDLTFIPTDLTFTTDNWNTAQTVTVSAVVDADATDDTDTVTYTATGGGYSTTTDLTVTVTDSRTGRIILSTNTLTVTEESSALTYTVVLDTKPTNDVIVRAEVINPFHTLDISPGFPADLIFTTDNWDIAQTITVGSFADFDLVTNTDTLTHMGRDRVTGETSGYSGLTATDLTITLLDNEEGIISAQRVTTNALTEEGSIIRPYEVSISPAPPTPVTITITSDNSYVTFMPSTLTFNNANHFRGQAISMSALDDPNSVDETVTFTLTATGSIGFEGLTTDFMLTVTDNDPAGVTVSETALTVTEGDTNGGTYTVAPVTQPISDLTVTPSVTASDVATLSPTSLVFTSDNWQTAQTVTVIGTEDPDSSDETTTTVTHATTSADSTYNGLTVDSVTLDVTDDDMPNVRLSETMLTVDESGSGDYTVVLGTLPTATVTITPSSNNGDVTFTPASLMFTTDNWDTAQSVTVSAASDADSTNDMATLSHTAAGGDYAGVSVETVAVTVDDDDNPDFTLSETMLTVTEGTTGMSYTVELDTMPTATVTITLTSDDTSIATVSSGTLDFTTTNWDTPQTVTVSATDDDDAADETTTLRHTASGGDYEGLGLSDNVAVTVNDDETASVTVSETALSVNETESGTYTVVLNTEPTVPVTIGVSTSGSSDVTVSPSTLQFDASNWRTPQTVNVNAADDDDAADDTAGISHAISGGEYATVSVAGLTVAVDDDDTIGYILSTTSLTVMEGGGNETYTLRLNTEPTDDFSVRITQRPSGIVTLSGSLDFTPANWDTPQTITVSAVDDGDAADATVTILQHGLGADYDGVSTANLVITVIDDDTAGVTLSPSTLVVNEEGTGTYTVVLDTLPNATVTVTPSISGDSDVIFMPASLMFTTDNWDTAQTVTVSAADDRDANNDTATLSHAVSGGDYALVTAADLTVTVDDDDDPGFTLSETTVAVTEGAAGMSYTVELDTLPTATVTITLTSDDTSIATVSPATLDFTTTNWDSAQTVTVSATDDADAANETTTLRHTTSGGDSNYVGLTGDVTVTVTDDDTAGVTVSQTALTVDESGSNIYTVVLNTEPTVPVTIGVSTSSGSDSDVTVSPATLRFNAGNWDNEQTVTVRAADDADAVNDTASVTHTISGGEYETVTVAGVTVTVDDNNDPGMTLSVTDLTVDEDTDDSTYTVVLDTLPSATVTVSSASNNSEVTISPTMLTFTTENWNIAQSLTVTAANDADFANDMATVTHTTASTETGYNGLTSDLTVTVRDNEANLSALVISQADLDPAFDGYTLKYVASVENTVTSITVTATPVDSTATVVFNHTSPEGVVTTETRTGGGDFTMLSALELDVGQHPITIAVTPMGGTPTDTITYTVTANISQGLKPSERENVHTQTTGTLSNNLAASTLGIIGDRLGSNPSFGASATLAGRPVRRMNGDELQGFIAQELVAGLQTFEDDGVLFDVDRVMERAMRDSEFVMPVGDQQRGLTLWGSVGEVSNEGDFDGTSYDGDTISALIGLDGLVASDWRVGMALGYSTGEIDYETEMDAGATTTTASGEVEKSMISVHPYMSWHPRRGMSLWASGGIGFGEYEISETVGTGDEVEWDGVDAIDWMAAIGAEQTFNYMFGFDTSLRLKGLWNRVDVDEAGSGDDELPEITSTNWRVRLETETGKMFTMESSGASVRPYGLLSARWDNGDAVGDDELFIDAGGGVEFRMGAFFLDLSFYRQVNDGDTEENSLLATGAFVFDNTDNGEGLTMSVSRKATGSILSSWQSHAFEDAAENDALSQNPAIETKMGYGWRVYPAFVDSALVKTYARSEFEDEGRNHSVGIDLEASKLSIGLESGFEELSEEMQALLRVRMNF